MSVAVRADRVESGSGGASVPRRVLTVGYNTLAVAGKRGVREVMRRYVPDTIAGGEKKGFSAPDASWFRGDSIEYVKRRLGDKRALIYDYLDRKIVDGLVAEHLGGRQNRRLLLWSLLYLEEWCHAFLDGVGLKARLAPPAAGGGMIQ